MEGFAYPGMGRGTPSPWALQQAQQQGHPPPGLMTSLGFPAASGAPPGMLPQQQQQQPWSSMHAFQLPPNFLPAGLGMPDGSSAASSGQYPGAAPAMEMPMVLGGMQHGYGGHQLQQLQQLQQLHQQQQQQQQHQQHAALRAGGMPTGFMPQQQLSHGGGGALMMVPSSVSGRGGGGTLPSDRAGGGGRGGVSGGPASPGPGTSSAPQPASPLARHSAEPRDVGRPAARPPIPPSGAQPLAADGGRHRSVQIGPHQWAGKVVWAKLACYPWWPAQVLTEDDPYIPAGSEPPRRGAVPVRFFGTYDFAWIESQRMLQPFADSFAEHSAQPDEDGFGGSVREAQAFVATGVLPAGFELALLEHDDSPPPAPKVKLPAAPAKRKAPASPAAVPIEDAPSPAKPRSRVKVASKSLAAGPSEDAPAPAKPRSRTKIASKSQARKPEDPATVEERLRGIRQGLGLEAPPDSPYATAPCLDGLRELLGRA